MCVCAWCASVCVCVRERVYLFVRHSAFVCMCVGIMCVQLCMSHSDVTENLVSGEKRRGRLAIRLQARGLALADPTCR